MQITIRDELVPLLEKRAEEKGFKDVESYIVYILEQIAAKIASQQQDGYTKKDKEIVKKRLRDLGYF